MFRFNGAAFMTRHMAGLVAILAALAIITVPLSITGSTAHAEMMTASSEKTMSHCDQQSVDGDHQTSHNSQNSMPDGDCAAACLAACTALAAHFSSSQLGIHQVAESVGTRPVPMIKGQAIEFELPPPRTS